MEIKTILGVTWTTPTPGEVVFILFLLILIAVVFVLLKYRQSLLDKNVHDRQLFLFRMKNRGLSNFQIKIINNIVSTLRLKNPNILLDNSHLFENAIGKFLLFLRDQNENEESLATMAKDIVILYEKLYHPTKIRKPLETMQDLEINQMVYIITEEKETYLGKLITKTAHSLELQLFRTQNHVQSLTHAREVMVHVWRLGDAEYTFLSNIVTLNENLVTLAIPETFTRAHEFRHPFIETLIEVKIMYDAEQECGGTITKINDYEAVIKSRDHLDYQKDYQIYFKINDFNVHITATMIADKTVKENEIYYYTLKFIEMSEAARNILKRYIYEHL